MRISMNEDDNMTYNKQDENYDTAGPEDTEVAGPGGANLIGGDVTSHQNAAVEADQSTQVRVDSAKMEERQQAGEVGNQCEEFHPKAEDSAGDDAIVDAGNAVHKGSTPNEDAHEDAKKNSENSAAGDAVNETATSQNEGRSELDETKAQLLQVAADFENFRRNASRRETEAREYAVRGVLEDLLPVLDNFERAVQAAEKTDDVKSLKIGVEYILQQFQEALKSCGAQPIEAVGKTFDPLQHEALEEIESDSPAGTVVDDVQRGYIFKGKVIRPSRVRVAK